MTDIPDGGSFALVAYVPDPLASFLYEMRQSLSGMPCPQPHITILPPRPLRVLPDFACRRAEEILQSRHEFPVELSKVCCFADTNVLYLDLNEGASEICTLHHSLNRDDLRHQEEFDFRPHLTIGGPIPPMHLPATVRQAEAKWRAASVSPRFTLSEITCLLQEGGNGKAKWERLWLTKLNPTPAKQLQMSCDLLTNTDQQ